MGRRLARSLQQYIRDVLDPSPESQRMLFQFSTAAERSKWEVFTDKSLGLGGSSTAELAQCPDVEDALRFRGQLSHAVDGDDPTAAKRTGIAGFHNKVWAREGNFLDLDAFTHLRLRMRGDGRPYLVNVRTENWISGADKNFDIYQAFLPLRRPGEWQEIDVSLSDFVLTWKGRLTEARVFFNPKAVTSIGFGVAGGYKQQAGPFQLDVHWVKGCNLEAIPIQ